MIEIKVTEPDEHGWESKSIYFKKDDEPFFLGLHAIGMTQEDGFHNMEAWANKYNLDKTFKSSIFRIFGPIEETAEDLIGEGWVIVSDWEIK